MNLTRLLSSQSPLTHLESPCSRVHTPNLPLRKSAKSNQISYSSLKIMGFPVGYSDIFFPKLILYSLSLLGFIRKFISVFLRLVGLGDFLEPEFSPDPTAGTHFHSVSAVLIRELLPVVKFSEIVDPPECCAVCLYEFDAGDEIRRLTNCRHIFHRCCLDRWMDHDQKTCPLCRTPFIPDDLQDSFNERLWAASGIADYYGDSSSLVSSP